MTQVPGRRRWRSTISGWLTVGLVVGPLLAFGPRAHAGGGGEDMLLLVNPYDQQSLRIANQYVQQRAIPDRNILFVNPYKSDGSLHENNTMPAGFFRNRVARPIVQHLDKHGLNDQIDFIGAIGLPYRTRSEGGQLVSLTAALNLSDAIGRGASLDGTILRPDDGGIRRSKRKVEHVHEFVGSPTFQTPVDYNPALHVATPEPYNPSDPTVPLDPDNFVATKMRVGGMVAYTGINGNTVEEVARSLNRSVQATGTHPDGKFHFVENSGDARNLRVTYFEYLIAPSLETRGLPYTEQDSSRGFNAPDAIGVLTHSNSVQRQADFLPGAYADNITSLEGKLHSNASNMTQWIRQGAAATSGPVDEPFARPERFPHPGIFLSIADGLNLAESYAGSVYDIHMGNFLGDMLGQPYAQVPDVALNSGPRELATVQGQLTLQAGATVERGRVFEYVDKDVAVEKLELYVDGKLYDTINGATGQFNLDTTTLSDGYHELRVVAVNDTNAESQGHLIRGVVVNNQGRAVQATPNATTLDADDPLRLDLSALGGQAERIELRYLGNTVATLDGAAGQIELDPNRLGFGTNRVVPVAVFNDGSEVAATPLAIERRLPIPRRGRPQSPAELRRSGLRIEYYVNAAGNTIDDTDFSGPPDRVEQISKIQLKAPNADEFPFPDAIRMPSDLDVDGLAIRIIAHFMLYESHVGEYTFFLPRNNDMGRLLIDGVELTRFHADEYYDYLGQTVWLGEGEHTLVFEAANHVVDGDDSFFLNLWVRGPDARTRLVNTNGFYTVVPEPASALLLMLTGSTPALARPRRLRRHARRSGP